MGKRNKELSNDPWPKELFNWPFALLIIVTFVNDHYFKSHYPSFITGKLSDISGTVMFVFVLFYILRVVLVTVHSMKLRQGSENAQPNFSEGGVFALSLIVTFSIFLLINLSSTASHSMTFIMESTIFKFSKYKPVFHADWTDTFTVLISIPLAVLFWLDLIKKSLEVKKKSSVMQKTGSFIILLSASFVSIATGAYPPPVVQIRTIEQIEESGYYLPVEDIAITSVHTDYRGKAFVCSNGDYKVSLTTPTDVSDYKIEDNLYSRQRVVVHGAQNIIIELKRTQNESEE